ncbi:MULTISPECIES: RagB/SusD family nutrient uptake outer membrane protein [Parabacteroides]|uniref:RagB/SusD family nutrient uptake outer membrane protein n=1 Tax=Parabacteroides provencensis TaxID=1944636 RepID=UPI00130403CB|nr:RagB/SusD family nutrient uptake outer membrane protein [Parabacteroides provencensis]
MMKKINIYIFSLLLILSTLSCVDFLDKEPLDAPSDESFLRNENEMQMALTGCYNILWTQWNNMPFMFAYDCASDIGYERDANDLLKMGQGAGTPSNKIAALYWTEFYEGIARCNFLINNMNRGKENVPLAVYDKIEAEAKFLRAYYYSNLIELFGDVPLILDVVSLETSQVANTPKSTTVDFLLQELTEAADILPEEHKPLSGKASKGAALALKARIALYNERWQEAISAASGVMAMEGDLYGLEDDYSLLFRKDGQSSKEIIFSIQYMNPDKVHTMYRLIGSRTAGGFTNKKPAYQMADSYECIDGLPIDKSPLYDPQKPWENRDPRLYYTIAVPGSEFLGYQFETHADSILIWNYLTETPTRIVNKDANNSSNPYSTYTGICWRKYANVEDRLTSNLCETNAIVIRYAEVLLIYAEAKIKAGEIDQSVLDAINKVRSRESVKMPGITTTDPVELFYAVCRERKYELASEGFRLFDIRRWGIAEDVMNQPLLGRMSKGYPDQPPRIDSYGNAYYDDSIIAKPGESSEYKMRLVDNRTFNPNRDYLWPIPLTEMETNAAIKQNNGY